MKNELKVGEEVMVMDDGLLILQGFFPNSKRPNNVGWVHEVWPNEILVEFPIGNDNPKDHSQVTPYPKNLVIKTEWTKKYRYKYKHELPPSFGNNKTT